MPVLQAQTAWWTKCAPTNYALFECHLGFLLWSSDVVQMGSRCRNTGELIYVDFQCWRSQNIYLYLLLSALQLLCSQALRIESAHSLRWSLLRTCSALEPLLQILPKQRRDLRTPQPLLAFAQLSGREAPLLHLYGAHLPPASHTELLSHRKLPERL